MKQLYNFISVSAESIVNPTLRTIITGTAADSICPKGWRLPRGNSDIQPSYKGVYVLYPSSAARKLPISYALDRFINYKTGEVGDSDSTTASYYWAISVMNYNNSYLAQNAYVQAGSFTYESGVPIIDGASVRCVKQ